MRSPYRSGRVASIVVGLATALAAPAAAQEDLEGLIALCAQNDIEAHCREQALTVQAAHAAVGLLAAGGTQIPGSSSTLGRRFGGMPRISVSLRPALLFDDLPASPGPGSSPPWESEGFTGFGLQGSLALGLFDGFSPLPTVGGILSLDVLGAAGALWLPDGAGFGSDPRYAGVGVRLGLLRESFTLPGVSVSASRRWLGDVELATTPAPGVLGDLDPVVTSVRLVAGKDLISLGFLAGAGWDRYRSEGEFQRNSVCPGSCPITRFDELESDRLLFFGGAALNLLLLQLSAEGGWARGFDDVPGRPAGGYDPAGGAFFASAALRLTL